MGELLRMNDQSQDIVSGRMGEMIEVMRLMIKQNAELKRSVAALEKEVHRLKTLTPMQERELKAVLHEQAARLCGAHGADGCEKKVAAAIRKDIKTLFGIDKLRELPRDDYAAAVRAVRAWDDWTVMKRIKRCLTEKVEETWEQRQR